MASSADWHRRRERGSSWGMRFVAWLYLAIGHRFAQLLLHPIVLYFFLTDRPGRDASHAYLARVFATPIGARYLDRAPAMRESFRHYLEFGRAILDRVGIWLGRSEDFSVRIEGLEHLEWLVEGGRGGLILGAHVGSFDVMKLIANEGSPRTVKVLMHTTHAPAINELFRQLAETSGKRVTVGVIEAKSGSYTHVLEVKKCIDRGEVVAVLADRLNPYETGGSRAVRFLGGTASVPESPMRLAAVLKCPVVLMAGLRTGPRRYTVCVERLAERLRIPRRGPSAELDRACQTYADWLERMCLRAPYQWFNFYDFWAVADASTRRADVG